ncbi:hypothetical protein pb186bvf_018008 [Paramecium bursaria]
MTCASFYYFRVPTFITVSIASRLINSVLLFGSYLSLNQLLVDIYILRNHQSHLKLKTIISLSQRLICIVI